MRRKHFSSLLLRQFLAIVALIATLVATTWAKPKFKVLSGFPNGGLWSGLTLDAKGNLYGVTTGGGDNGVGAVFEMTRNAKGQWTMTTLHSFDGKDGARPNGDLIFDAAGNLYGTTPAGGAYYDGGTVFELTPGSGGWTFSVLYSFCHEYGCPDGGGPQDGLVQDKDRNLVGTARAGLFDQGVVFELTPGSQGWTYSVLYNFGSHSYDGSDPFDALALDTNGNLYGTTYRGGRYGGGTVFRLGRGAHGWSDRLLYSLCPGGFPCVDGAGPESTLVFDKAGNIYATTHAGGRNCNGYVPCGTLFQLKLGRDGRWTESVLYGFPNSANGFGPVSGVTLDGSGNLYGTTATGGLDSCPDGCGVVYKMARVSGGKWKYTVLHKFTGGDGFVPNGRLILDGRGNLYGTAFITIFEVTP